MELVSEVASIGISVREQIQALSQYETTMSHRRTRCRVYCSLIIGSTTQRGRVFSKTRAFSDNSRQLMTFLVINWQKQQLTKSKPITIY